MRKRLSIKILLNFMSFKKTAVFRPTLNINIRYISSLLDFDLSTWLIIVKRSHGSGKPTVMSNKLEPKEEETATSP